MAASTAYKRNSLFVKKWTEEENQCILNYLKETITSGHPIEKPTANLYYGRMIKEKQLKGCNAKLLKNKVRNFKTTYIKALKWQDQIGKKVLASEGEARFQSMNLPSNAATVEIGASLQVNLNEEVECMEVFENSSIEEDGEIIGNMHRRSSVGSESRYSSITEQTHSVESDFEEILETSTNTSAPKLSKSQNRMLMRPSPCLAPKVQDNGTSAYQEVAIAQEETDKNHLEIKKEMLQFEKVKFEKDLEMKSHQMQLERDKLELEKVLKTKEIAEKMELDRLKFMEELELRRQQMELEREKLQIKKLELNNHREIRLMELNIEKLKYEKLNNAS